MIALFWITNTMKHHTRVRLWALVGTVLISFYRLQGSSRVEEKYQSVNYAVEVGALNEIDASWSTQETTNSSSSLSFESQEESSDCGDSSKYLFSWKYNDLLDKLSSWVDKKVRGQ